MNNLADVIDKLIGNGKRILGGFFGFVLGYTYIRYGLLSVFILAIFTVIGYNYSDIFKKIKIIIRDRMNEEY
jgi:hypothetical protein